MPAPEPRVSIQVIERQISLLDALARQLGAVTLKQLAAETKLHPSTAHRILAVMLDHHLVERTDPGRYRLGIRLLELGSLVKSRLNVRAEALPVMQELHRRLGETVNLSIRRDDEVVTIERTAAGSSMMRVVQIVGARAPLHITAVGKIFLHADGPEAVRAYGARTGLPKYTDNTLTDPAKLQKELEQIAQHGYACDNEEAERGVSCIGAGILDDEGRLVAGLSVSAPSERLGKAWPAEVKNAAARISQVLGHRGT